MTPTSRYNTPSHVARNSRTLSMQWDTPPTQISILRNATNDPTNPTSNARPTLADRVAHQRAASFAPAHSPVRELSAEIPETPSDSMIAIDNLFHSRAPLARSWHSSPALSNCVEERLSTQRHSTPSPIEASVSQVSSPIPTLVSYDNITAIYQVPNPIVQLEETRSVQNEGKEISRPNSPGKIQRAKNFLAGIFNWMKQAMLRFFYRERS